MAKRRRLPVFYVKGWELGFLGRGCSEIQPCLHPARTEGPGETVSIGHPAPTSSGLRELKESAVVSEEMDSEWRRLGPAEASEICRERVRRQGPRRIWPLPRALQAQICDHPRPADLRLEPPPPTGHPVPKPHPHSGQLGALVQIPQVVPFSSEGGQDTAEGAVHCEGRGRPSEPPPHPLYPPPSSTHSPFWARAQKLRCRWA